MTFVDSCQDGDGEVEATELGARQDLEAFRHRQRRLPGRRGVRAGHAPHPCEDRRPRPALRAPRAPRAALQAQLNLYVCHANTPSPYPRLRELQDVLASTITTTYS